MREPNKGEVLINIDRLHELAVPVSQAMLAASIPILERYAEDETISPEEFAMSAIYSHCQGISALIESAVDKGARADQLRVFVENCLDNMEAPE